jgi:hypothetical protein
MKLVMKLSFLATLAACGCAEHTQPSMDFPAEGTVRPHQRMAEIQRSTGARHDGNLYASHFTDDALNSLGRAKLDSMLSDDESVRPLTIHMAPAADRSALMRRIEAVTAYLKDNGLSDQQMNFMSGLNDASYHPAAPDLANLRKTDTESAPTGGVTSTEGSSGEMTIK